MTTPDRNLDALFSPSSVALVGASADPTKWGQWLMPGLVRNRHRRPLTLVNRSARPLDGIPSIGSLLECDAPPELVVVCVPPAQVGAALDDAVAVGARAAIVITAGIDTVMGEGAEARMVERAAQAGLRIVGPNCLGLYDAASDLQVIWGDVQPGSLAIVSQSGQIGLECITAANACGLGTSRFVSIGNQRDVIAQDVLLDLAGRSNTKVVALYLETFGDGRGLIDAVQQLREAGQPTVLLTVGASAASAAAARSHTGSMTSASDVIDAACRVAGMVRVSSPWELVDVAAQLASPLRARGRRIAVVGDSGGQGGVAADLVHAGGLVAPPFEPVTQQGLAEVLPYTAAVGNPVDLGGGGTLDLGNYATIVEVAARSGEVDSVLLTGYFGAYCLDGMSGVDEPAAAARMVDVAKSTGVPVIVHSQAPTSQTLDLLRAGGIAAYPSIDRAARAAALGAVAALAIPRLLPPLGGRRMGGGHGYWAARAALGGYGLTFPDARRVGDVGAARAAAQELTMPVALKAGWLAHKSEVGGVVLGLMTPDAVAHAFEEMHSRLGEGEYIVEAMDTRRQCVEMLVGARNDPAFGPIVVVAAGGTEAEVLNDRAIELAPVDAAASLQMLQRLRCWPLLNGFRGRPRLDVDALVQTIVGVARLAADHIDVDELEVNPVRVSEHGAIAVDALIETAPGNGAVGNFL